MRKDILEMKPQIEEWIEQSQSKTFICNQLHCKHSTLDRYLSIMGISYCGNKSGKGKQKSKSQWTFFEYIENSTSIQSNKLRKKLLESGLKEHRCEVCNNDKFNNPIPLEVHHIDGNPANNVLSNLEMICPNCHALTDTYRGKNRQR